MSSSINSNSKKTSIFRTLFYNRWDPQQKQLSEPLVTLAQVKAAIEYVNRDLKGTSLSSSNPANFFKDFIRKSTSANKNWPAELKDLRWTAEQRTGGNNCFEFVPFAEDQVEPFGDPYQPSRETPVHRMQSITIPKVSRDLGRKDEQWVVQVSVQQGIIPTHLALHSRHQVEEIVHLQSSMKLRRTEIDALFMARLKVDGKTTTALITCEAKHSESILPDQIVNQANAALQSKKADIVIPMAIKVVPGGKIGSSAGSGGLIYVCEFEMCDPGVLFERKHLKVVSDCLYEFHPPIPGV